MPLPGFEPRVSGLPAQAHYLQARQKSTYNIVCDCKTSWLLYSTCIYACAYNIDNLYNSGRIDPPSIVRIVYILHMHYTYVHRKIKFFNSNIIALSVNSNELFAHETLNFKRLSSGNKQMQALAS